jgi:undecaprenyl-diphosphatase
MVDDLSFFMALFLGFIQGLTEFLPVSSSGHLSIIQNLITGGDIERDHMFFDVLLHFGTLVSVILVYRKDISELLRELFRGAAAVFGKKEPGAPAPPMRRFVWLLIVACVPLIAVPFVADYVENLYYNTIFIGCALIFTGLLLFLSDRMPKGRKDHKNAKVSDALAVGIAQAVAVVPGLSRAGTTIAMGTFAGFDREFAVKFSFILSLPAILAANILSLFKAVKAGIDMSLAGVYAAGMISAFVFGVAAISLIRYLARKGKFGVFAWYCFAAGAAAILLTVIL